MNELPSTWGYRLIRHLVDGTHDSLAIHEVWFDDTGVPVAWTDGLDVISETHADILKILSMIDGDIAANPEPIAEVNLFDGPCGREERYRWLDHRNATWKAL